MEYCNPLNLNYKYQHFGDKAHREGADPTLLLFKGKYYLFVSMSAGFYFSDDLIHWNWHENRNLDMYNYAPDVRQIGEYVYFCASDKGRPCTIWRSRDPLSDQWEKVKIMRKDRGRTAVLRWAESPGAIGYNVRFGVAPDKLYSSYQVYGANHVKILTLNAGQQYCFAVDAFNENGVTGGSLAESDKHRSGQTR